EGRGTRDEGRSKSSRVRPCSCSLLVPRPSPLLSSSLLLAGDLLGLLEGLFDRADHVERLLGQSVALAVENHAEAADRVFQRHVLAGRSGEHFGDVERLREEALDLARARYGCLVFL